MKRLLLIITSFLLVLPLVLITAHGQSENLASGKKFEVKTHIANANSYSEEDRFNATLLTDGVYGNADYGDKRWVKFYRATGRILTVDLGENCEIDNIKLRALQDSTAGVVAPKEVKVFVSQNNIDFAQAEIISGNKSPFLPSRSNGTEIATYDIKLTKIAARYVAISFDVTVNSFIDEIEIYGSRSTSLTPPAEFTNIIAPSKESYLSRDALDGDYDIVCFHAGYSPDNEIYVNNTKEAFLPYVGYQSKNKKITDTMFDSVMFLTLQGQCPSGGNLTITGGTTVISDWEMLLDNYFHPDYNLSALDAATAEVKSTLELDEDYKISVYLTIPYPKISDIEFGDYTGDGKVDKIDSYQACLDVTEWFMEQVDQRFAQADFQHIELKGYFCNSEGITRQRYDYEWDFARDATELMHNRGLKCVMIPYYQAVGIDAVEEFGFDAALMQPNLSFNATLQDDPEGTMNDFAETAKQLGLGIQMEIADGVRWEPEKLGSYYQQYLVSASQNGLMTDTVHAYYNGAGPGVFYDCANSSNAYSRWFYDMTYKFIKGTLDLPQQAVSDNATETINVNGTERVSGETGINGDWYCNYKITKQPAHGFVNIKDGLTNFVYSADRRYEGEDTFEFDIILNNNVIAHRVVKVNVTQNNASSDISQNDQSLDSQSPTPTENRDYSVIRIIICSLAAVICLVAIAVIVIKLKKKKQL